MHLDHKIPWNAVASNLKYIKENRQRNPPRTDLFPKPESNGANDLNHFVRVLASTIREFSLSERAKYPPANKLPQSGKLFDDSLFAFVESKYGLGPHDTNSATSNPLSPAFQDIEYWVQHPGPEVADALKILLATNQMTALLRLMNDPRVNVIWLNNISWGHCAGFKMIVDPALDAYLLINVASAVKFNAPEGSPAAGLSLLSLQSFYNFTSDALADYDFPAQNIPHRAFWLPRGVQARAITGGRDPLVVGGREETQAMNDYLKMCFELLYRYDVLMRERGIEHDWIEKITLNMSGGFHWGKNNNNFPLRFI